MDSTHVRLLDRYTWLLFQMHERRAGCCERAVVDRERENVRWLRLRVVVVRGLRVPSNTPSNCCVREALRRRPAMSVALRRTRR